MDGLKAKKYLHTSRKRFDPLSLLISLGALGLIVVAILGVESADSYFDLRSMIIVVLGTFASLLFQFDTFSCLMATKFVVQSFLGSPEKKLLKHMEELDDQIVSGGTIDELREGTELNGDLINDVVYMHKNGLLFEEIDEFVTSKVSDIFMQRNISVTILNRAATIAPALGLFGTVMGLMNVLQSLTDPSNIGSSMALALMTTAYGAGLGSLFFTPMAGRLEHHNDLYLEVYKQALSKVAILLKRDERNMEKAEMHEGMAA